MPLSTVAMSSAWSVAILTGLCSTTVATLSSSHNSLFGCCSRTSPVVERGGGNEAAAVRDGSRATRGSVGGGESMVSRKPKPVVKCLLRSACCTSEGGSWRRSFAQGHHSETDARADEISLSRPSLKRWFPPHCQVLRSSSSPWLLVDSSFRTSIS